MSRFHDRWLEFAEWLGEAEIVTLLHEPFSFDPAAVPLAPRF